MIIHARLTKERKLTDLQYQLLFKFLFDPHHCVTALKERRAVERLRRRRFLRRLTYFQYKLTNKGNQVLLHRLRSRAR